MSNTGAVITPDFKLYYKPIARKIAWYCQKISIKANRIE
jgi:hypothetical protein